MPRDVVQTGSSGKNKSSTSQSRSLKTIGNLFGKVLRPKPPLELCEACACIDLAKTFVRSARDAELSRIPIHDVAFRPTQGEHSDLACVLCKLIHDSHALCADEDGPWTDHLNLYYGPIAQAVFRGMSAEQYTVLTVDPPALDARYFGLGRRYFDGECIGVATVGNIPGAPNMLKMRALDPKKADTQLLKRWITTCQLDHGPDCNPRSIHQIASLRVVNVKTRRIGQAQRGCRYAALSYVWGAQQNASLEFTKSVGSDVPATIDDTIDLTKSLGLEYLWVDRYCIRQGHKQEKHDQIQQMDLIFQNAEVTIVAAAGADPTFGLPGAGRTTRKRQPQGQVGKYNLVSSMRAPLIVVQGSVWATRAWTYQEAVCSRRCLIFTEEQVHFECRQVHCRETINADLAPAKHNFFHKSVAGGSRSSGGGGMMEVVSGLSRSLSPKDLRVHINAYSRRRLTYESDALNGLLGVFRTFQDQEDPIHHFGGLPVYPLHGDPTFLRGSFLAGLTWKAAPAPAEEEVGEESIASASSPAPAPPPPTTITTTPEIMKRRKGFPSWSWTGWSNPVDCTGVDEHDISPACQVQLSTHEGVWMDFEEAFQKYISKNNFRSLSNVVEITAWVVKISWAKFWRRGRAGSANQVPKSLAWATAQAALDQNCDHRIGFPLALECEVDNGSDLSAIAFLDISSKSPSFVVLLVVRMRENGVAERVGYLEVRRWETHKLSLESSEFVMTDFRKDWHAGSAVFETIRIG
ncbi:heterokaryon incompatibility protein-domain-containing protein [Xylariales sp. PMI_506]|nr:heterokaryon incompatibility protein-domain-containing protein [Xylariales sp. PMI_506]